MIVVGVVYSSSFVSYIYCNVVQCAYPPALGLRGREETRRDGERGDKDKHLAKKRVQQPQQQHNKLNKYMIMIINNVIMLKCPLQPIVKSQNVNKTCTGVTLQQLDTHF